ncbi:MAG: DUF4013 domain-containing protein [Anaerolineae bacterium]|nr:DUF4013 domain-containing protein [Anaerolineae bacterium]
MDVGKSFTFMFEDKDWLVKILVGGVFGLLSMILIGLPFVMGYLLEVIRRVARDDPQPLPDWDNLGEKFVQGLVLMVILAIWLVPVWIVLCGQLAITLPLGDNPDYEGLVAAVSICGSCLTILWSLVVAIFTPAIFTRYAVTGQFGSGFQFGEIWRFTTRNIVNILIAVVLSWVAGLLASFGVILCFVGVFLTWFWSVLVEAHLFGQVYRLAEATPPAAEEMA